MFAFRIATLKPDVVNVPERVWPITESTMHLEGFDFVPGRPEEIFEAQGSQVDRWRLCPPDTSNP